MTDARWNDPIVEEGHRIRQEYAARFNNDIAAMFRDMREKQEQSRKVGRRIIPAPPRSDQTAEPAA